ncbi:MAG: hypothetical protein Q4D41_07410 [Prevotellaceae bacterium]|nr:hypothetical protein [Prevotellaceae bacterium]
MKKLLFIYPLLLASIFIFAACSDDDIPTTGVLNISFTSYESSWEHQTNLYIYTIEQPNTVLKKVELSVYSDNRIELNPGNYILFCSVPNRYLLSNKAIQIQAGKTETITISKNQQ